MTDFTSDDLDRLAAEKGIAPDGKLGNAPPHGSPPEMVVAFLNAGFGLPAGYYVSRVIRHGGREHTALDVLIQPPGGGAELRVVYQSESDCSNPAKLRSRAAADTRGLTRGSLINSPRAAMAMYEALCTLADHFRAADQIGQTWEWVQHLRSLAAVTQGEITDYYALRRIQGHEYSKKLVEKPPVDNQGRPQRPVPLLLHTAADDYFISARHLAVFLRYDLGAEDAGSDDQILSRLMAIGGDRIPVQEWDSTTRERTHKVRLVLCRLPNPNVDET